mgnify:CR=1 FL=1
MADDHLADPAEPTPEAGESAGLPVVDTKAQPCRHLRSNGMYLYSDGTADDPDRQQYSSSACWCIKTMTGFGPDDDIVGWLDCRDPARSCYMPLY